jgi:zinc transporter ZupT
MEEFIIAVASGLILAAVSGLVFLAYKHPEGYLIVGGILIFLTIVICALSTAYFLGYTNGCSDSSNDRGVDTYESRMGWNLVISGAIFVFLLLLMKLPAITKTDGEDDANKNKPPKRKRP